MAKAGRKPIYDVRQAVDLHIRMTAEQKSQLVQASQLSTAGTVAPFIHQMAEQVAPLIIDLNECKITPDQFKHMVAEVMYVLASPSPSPSPSPECEDEGE